MCTPLQKRMPYTQQENLGGQMQDRQFSIFTTANVLGAGGGGVIAWQLCALLKLGGAIWSPGWFVQSAAIIAGVAIGVLLTLRWNGQSALDRLQLFIGYQMRRMAGTTTIQPEAPTTAPTQHGMPTLYRNGRVIARPYAPYSDETLV